MSNDDPVPHQIRDVFLSPWVYEVLWDGEVHVNGSTTGSPGFFEPLWDLFVSSPPVRFIRDKDGEVRSADILLPLR